MQSADMDREVGILRHRELLEEAEDLRRSTYARAGQPSRLALVLVRLGESIAECGRRLEAANRAVATSRTAHGRAVHG